MQTIFLQTNSHKQMYEPAVEYHKILQKNLKAAHDKTHFMLKKPKFFADIIEKRENNQLSWIEGF